MNLFTKLMGRLRGDKYLGNAYAPEAAPPVEADVPAPVAPDAPSPKVG